MSNLDWRQTAWGYECDGYRIVAAEEAGSGQWRLEPIGAAWLPNRPEFRVSFHQSVDDAVLWAQQNEKEVLRRMVTSGHFVLFGISLALFVFLSQFIGTLAGLALVAGAFYMTLRSAGNGLGALLQEAWGWTRPKAKPTLLERLVVAAAHRIRRSRLTAARAAGDARVRELAPGPPGRS